MAVTMNEPCVSVTTRYTVPDASRILGISRPTLRKYAMMGLVKAGYWRNTKQMFFTGAELKKFWRTSQCY